jgi:hypothetical protein
LNAVVHLYVRIREMEQSWNKTVANIGERVTERLLENGRDAVRRQAATSGERSGMLDKLGSLVRAQYRPPHESSANAGLSFSLRQTPEPPLAAFLAATRSKTGLAVVTSERSERTAVLFQLCVRWCVCRMDGGVWW